MTEPLPPRTGEDAADRRLDRPPHHRSGPGPDSRVAYVGLVTRAIAIVVDAVLIDMAALTVTGALLLVESVFFPSRKHHAAVQVVGGLLFVVWVVGYFGFFWTTTGQTPGSRVMQIRVTRADGTRLQPRRALVRLIGMVVSLPLFWGYLPILWSPRRRCVFDVAAGTVVTEAPPGGQADETRVRRPHASGIEPPSTVP
jgi:uncharacterized RDD family membrane protein YckC